MDYLSIAVYISIVVSAFSACAMEMMERYLIVFFFLSIFFANGDFKLRVKSEENSCLLERSFIGNGFHRLAKYTHIM